MSAARERFVASAARLAAPVFEAQGWTYTDDGGETEYQPTEADLALVIDHLMRDINEDEGDGITEITTGRLVVGRDDEGWWTVSLRLGADNFLDDNGKPRR